MKLIFNRLRKMDPRFRGDDARSHGASHLQQKPSCSGKRVSIFFLNLFALLLLASNMCFAQTDTEAQTTPAPIEITDAVVRATFSNQNSIVYMNITNHQESDDVLVAASSPLADRVELHAIMDNHGTKRMREIDEIALPVDQTVMLKSGTLHLMLIGLKKQLVPDQNVPIELHFRNAGTQQVTAKVVTFKTHHLEPSHSPAQ